MGGPEALTQGNPHQMHRPRRMGSLGQAVQRDGEEEGFKVTSRPGVPHDPPKPPHLSGLRFHLLIDPQGCHRARTGRHTQRHVRHCRCVGAWGPLHPTQLEQGAQASTSRVSRASHSHPPRPSVRRLPNHPLCICMGTTAVPSRLPKSQFPQEHCPDLLLSQHRRF